MVGSNGCLKKPSPATDLDGDSNGLSRLGQVPTYWILLQWKNAVQPGRVKRAHHQNCQLRNGIPLPEHRLDVFCALRRPPQQQSAERGRPGPPLYPRCCGLLAAAQVLRSATTIFSGDTSEVRAGQDGSQLRRLVFWAGQNVELAEYVCSNQTCQRTKAELGGPRGLLHPPPVPSRRREMVRLDWIAWLPTTAAGFDMNRHNPESLRPAVRPGARSPLAHGSDSDGRDSEHFTTCAFQVGAAPGSPTRTRSRRTTARQVGTSEAFRALVTSAIGQPTTSSCLRRSWFTARRSRTPRPHRDVIVRAADALPLGHRTLYAGGPGVLPRGPVRPSESVRTRIIGAATVDSLLDAASVARAGYSWVLLCPTRYSNRDRPSKSRLVAVRPYWVSAGLKRRLE